MSKLETLEKLLVAHLKEFQQDGGSGGGPNLPDFELYAWDYLEFAEKKLNNIDKYKDNVDELINCVAHLKRAVDCQLDTFFYSCNLYKIIHDRNLKFDKKLEFLKGIGVFSSRSLNRLNSLRNKMEHQYEVPKIIDIELYYDLVSAFISVIQGLIFLLGSYRSVDLTINTGDNNLGRFNSTYDDNKLEIRVSWYLTSKGERNSLTATLEELDDFIYFFKVHILLIQIDTFSNWEHIFNRIKIEKIGNKKGRH